MTKLVLFAALGVAASPSMAADLDDDVIAAKHDAKSYHCRRLIGATAGMTTTDRLWVFIDDGPVRFAGSPMLSLGCDVGSKGPRWFVGVESAPLYRTRRINSPDLGRAWITLTSGATFGTGVVQAGPVATLGWGYVGLGVRGLYLPWTGSRGRRGFEARVQGQYNGGFGAQVAVLYTMTSLSKGDHL